MISLRDTDIFPPQYKGVFESNHGYNVTARLGRIYTFSCRGVAAYLCSVNPDLRDLSFWFREFGRVVQKKVRLNIAARRITLYELHDIQLGILTVKEAIERHMPVNDNG